MLLRQPAGPYTGCQRLERLRLTDAGERVTKNILDDGEDAKRGFSVGSDPVL